MRTGTSSLPLHGGQCPAWLFVHMKALIRAIVEVIVEDSGPEEVLRRLSDPYWFQALGCVAGFDWHSSGVTTTVCGALKEGLKEAGPRAGLFVAGGKGAVSRRTPLEIAEYAERYPVDVDAGRLAYASRMAAKIDSAAVQDTYQIYHHCFVFSQKGHWAVVQQGMNTDLRMARRYHWLEERLASWNIEPHTAVCCDLQSPSLNLVSADNQSLQDAVVAISREHPERVAAELDLLVRSGRHLHLLPDHPIPRTGYINKALKASYEKQHRDFEQLMAAEGVGPGTLRALCLVAEVTFGMAPSYTDPARYAFAHGGKDGYPFPVNESDMENSYHTLARALKRARTGYGDKLEALRRLAAWHSRAASVDTAGFTLAMDSPEGSWTAKPDSSETASGYAYAEAFAPEAASGYARAEAFAPDSAGGYASAEAFARDSAGGYASAEAFAPEAANEYTRAEEFSTAALNRSRPRKTTPEWCQGSLF